MNLIWFGRWSINSQPKSNGLFPIDESVINFFCIFNSHSFKCSSIALISFQISSELKRIIVASTNPVKISCALTAFEQAFPHEKFKVAGTETPSGVSHQPLSEEETLKGAQNRLEFIKAYQKDADYFVSIEGGLKKNEMGYDAFAWVIVHDKRKTGKAQTATFELPEPINSLIDQGLELGYADDKIFKRKDSKRKNGSVGILTKNIIDRTEYYRHALILALIPFLNKELYK